MRQHRGARGGSETVDVEVRDGARRRLVNPTRRSRSAHYNGNQRQRAYQSRRLPAARARMSELRIQNREHPAFELFPARHGQGYRRRRITPDARDDVQQMFGVVSRASATRQRQIVARSLALGAKLLRGGPHQWVEPVHCAGETAHGVSNEIVAAHVRELVQEYCSTAIERPAITLGRKHDCRLEQATGERHLRIFAAEQARRLVERESIRDFPERCDPVFGVERTRPIHDPADDECRVSQGAGDRDEDSRPD